MSTSLTITTDSDLGRIVRESLHLEDGDRVLIEPTGDGLVVRREDGPHLLQKQGTWVFSAGQPSNYSVREILNAVRDERIEKHGEE
jgi:hypothetical protein